MSLKRQTKPSAMINLGHTTPATAHLIQTRAGRSSSTRRKRSARSSATMRRNGSRGRKRARSSGASSAKRTGAKMLKAGTAAAKAWGKKMAALRKRKA